MNRSCWRRRRCGGVVAADVFIPKFRPGLDETAHEPDARRVLQHFLIS
jgi:hypothetical protein